MDTIARRQFLKLTAFAPAFPLVLARSAQALNDTNDRVLIIVRMIGGNDGLNSLIPFRDDAYYKGRPTIAIPRTDVLPLEGNDLGLHPALADFRWLIDEGFAGIVQNVGYANSSRSHSVATEIWETGSTANKLPREGWIGRYLDNAPDRSEPVVGLEFGETVGRTLTSNLAAVRAVGNPVALLRENLVTSEVSATSLSALDQVRLAQNELAVTRRLLDRASKGSGSKYGYPDTAFGESLRWTGNLIEQHTPTRVFYVTLGSFDSGFSFDTHLTELAAHQALYADFARGLRALATHLRTAGELDRVQLLTFSDFGRQSFENKQAGTDHGDASIVFAMGGKMQAGIHGTLPDIAGVYDGGLRAKIDFRQIYAGVLKDWFKVDPQTVLDQHVDPFPLFRLG
jgi:uncharacterized protein (DUF1501 family)